MNEVKLNLPINLPTFECFDSRLFNVKWLRINILHKNLLEMKQRQQQNVFIKLVNPEELAVDELCSIYS